LKGNCSAKPGLDGCNYFVKLGFAVNKTIAFLGTEEQLKPLKMYTSNQLREMGLDHMQVQRADKYAEWRSKEVFNNRRLCISTHIL